jgi:hypothetical protein
MRGFSLGRFRDVCCDVVLRVICGSPDRLTQLERIRSFDTSGKTLAEWHHRKTFGSARAERSAAGFLIQHRFDTSGKTPAE